MQHKVLIFHSDLNRARPLAAYFQKSGASVWFAAEARKAALLVQNHQPDLVFVDLHADEEQWVRLITSARQQAPGCVILATTHHPDVRNEMKARELGVSGFLREPFTSEWIERALSKPKTGLRPGSLTNPPVQGKIELPRVRLPMRLKIALPYAVLALLFALGASYLVSRYVFESMRDRFTAQLVDVGVLAADWMVGEENRLLETVRLLANTQGLANAIEQGDSTALHQIVLPVAVNSGEEAVEVINGSGQSLLSLRADESVGKGQYLVEWGDHFIGSQGFVQSVLAGVQDEQGDKFTGLAHAPEGGYFFIAGPVYDDLGKRVGAVAVGRTLKHLAEQIRRDTLAHVTIYGLDGRSLSTTYLLEDQLSPVPNEHIVRVLARQNQESSIREFQSGSSNYSEILGPWEARGGMDLGVIGVSLAQNYLTRPNTLTRMQIFAFVLFVFVGVTIMGAYIAHQITSPLSNMVQASVQVAQGNLEVKVPSQGNDEIGVLSYAFNYMVSGLQEGFIYRDLLGRTVSPQVREALRHSFASGDLRLEGQNTVATVLMSDIRSFTTISEREQPTTILDWLNEYFRALVPVITTHGGVVDKFEGDALLAFFGILPKPTSPEESAYQACCAAVEILKVLEEVNARRAARGEPALITGIGVNTGMLTAGGLGTADRLNYTIIGDTVNTTQRLQGMCREFGESGVVISEYTLEALAGRRGQFRLEPLGERSFKGKRELVWLYRLLPLQDSSKPTRPAQPAKAVSEEAKSVS